MDLQNLLRQVCSLATPVLCVSQQQLIIRGWNQDLLPNLGGLVSADTQFPPLLQYFEKKCNMELTSILQSSKADWQNMRTTQRVKEGLKMRLQMNVPHIGEQHNQHSLIVNAFQGCPHNLT